VFEFALDGTLDQDRQEGAHPGINEPGHHSRIGAPNVVLGDVPMLAVAVHQPRLGGLQLLSELDLLARGPRWVWVLPGQRRGH
jgi:hypothetical protein